jgi:HAD superfamily hydrolase (TIGR01549 family)
MFDAVLFDVGGVLALPDPTVIGPLLAPYGASTDADVHVRAHYAAMAAKSASGAGETDWREYDDAYVAAVATDSADRDLAALVLGRTRNAHLWRWPVPGAVDALRTLAAAQVPMGVVSNASGQVEEMLSRSAICQVGGGRAVEMRVIVDSHVVGVAKPDPAIFDHALVHFDGIDRSRVAYVGDSVTMDIGGARAAGLLPVLIDPFDDHDGADFARIRSIGDLLSTAPD